MRTLLTVFVCGIVAALSACSSDDAPTADEFLAAYPAAYCSHIFACCSSTERSYGSTSQCETDVKTRLTELLAFREANVIRAAFDGDAARACLDRLEANNCGDRGLLTGCLDGVTVGQQQQSEECYYSAECTSFNCVQSQKGNKGYCGLVGQDSTTCSGDDRGCVGGTFCSNGRICTSVKAAGDSCARAAECLSGVCSPSYHECIQPQDPVICDGN